MSDMAVRFSNVSRYFGKVAAVDSVSFDIEAGQLVTLLGPSGCGKTTILRMIAGLETPSSGRIEIAGLDVTRLPATERDVSMVFQSYALFPHMTVLENVGYGLATGKLNRAQQQDKAREGLKLVGLTGLEQRLPSQLSGGQQQRVAVARALVIEPKVLLFDEPLSNLDAQLRRHMREEIRELQQKLALTAVYVTHDQEEAMAISDRIVVMRGGRIAQEGSPTELYRHPADSFIADFIGGADLVEAELLAVSGNRCRLRMGVETVELEIGHCSAQPGPVMVAIRHWAARIAPGGAVRGRIVKAAYLGSHHELTLQTSFGDLFLVQDLDHAIALGADIAVDFDPQGLAVLSRGA